MCTVLLAHWDLCMQVLLSAAAATLSLSPQMHPGPPGMLPPGAPPEASVPHPNEYAQLNPAWTSIAANQAVQKIAEQQVGTDGLDAWIGGTQVVSVTCRWPAS